MNMKSIVSLLLMIFVTSLAFAQDAKPTKAQTIEYIQSNYPEAVFYSAAHEDHDVRLSGDGEVRDLTITIVGTRLTASYRDKVTKSLISPDITNIGVVDHDENCEISFDLKDVESIEVGWKWIIGAVTYDDAEEGRRFPMFLAFNAVNKKPLLTMSKDGGAPESLAQVMIPFRAAEDIQQAIGEIKSSQMFKAFEHLRKLSGAPDPIRF